MSDKQLQMHFHFDFISLLPCMVFLFVIFYHLSIFCVTIFLQFSKYISTHFSSFTQIPCLRSIPVTCSLSKHQVPQKMSKGHVFTHTAARNFLPQHCTKNQNKGQSMPEIVTIWLEQLVSAREFIFIFFF